MADWVKMAVKAGIIVTATAIIVALFANIQVPAIDTTVFAQSIGSARSFITYWAPVSSNFLIFFIGLLGIKLAFLAAKIGLIAIRWVLKVNE